MPSLPDHRRRSQHLLPLPGARLPESAYEKQSCFCSYFEELEAALPASNSRRSFCPSGHSPIFESELMCPARPIFTNRLPHASAKNFARSSETHSSSALATSVEGNGNRFSGIGLKPFGSFG